MPSTPKPCGTPASFWRHLNRGEEPCQQDRDAVNAYQRAHMAARRDLAGEFRRRFDELLAARSGSHRYADAMLALVREQPARFAEIFAVRKADAGV